MLNTANLPKRAKNMSSRLDVRPGREEPSRIVDIILKNRTCSWRELIVSSVAPDCRIRIFTDPERRAKHVKAFYWSVRKSYPSIPLEALDYAFEAYLLGWCEPYQVVSIARQYCQAQNMLFNG